MSFWIYTLEGDKACPLKSLSIAGKNGMLARYLSDFKSEDTPFSWQLLESDILRIIDPSLDQRNHTVVVDMEPENLIQACFYRITCIQGVSDETETDVVLAFKVLYQGTLKQSGIRKCIPNNFQKSDRQMMEAMRLTGGTMVGSYRWAKPKMDIGAAVCPAGSHL